MLELAVQKRVTTSKRIFKFADDTYLVIPAVSSRSCVRGRNIARSNLGTDLQNILRLSYDDATVTIDTIRDAILTWARKPT